MGGLGFFAGLFAIIVLFSITSQSPGNGAATSTPRGDNIENSYTTEEVNSPLENNSYTAPDDHPSTRLTPYEIEKKIARLYDEVDELEEEVREQMLREPASPYRGMVTLRAASTRTDDPEREYVTITASSKNQGPINVSDWYLESYVTEETAGLPHGIRVPTSIYRQRNTLDNIYLEPGERAIVHSGSAPQGFSFHENVCTGYFTEHADYYPSLRRQCPRPIDEMEEYGRVSIENDACYDAVRSIGRCEIVNENDFKRISNQCERFIIDDLNYSGCLNNHRYDPFFDNVGEWHVYLNKRRDLWREVREIIQLKDENDRIIDVVEY